MAHGFGERSTQPYIQLVGEMYPKVSFNLQNIIAEVLQDADPIEEQSKKNKRDEIIKGVQYSYAISGEAKNDIDFLKGYHLMKNLSYGSIDRVFAIS